MERITIDGLEFAYDVRGAGDPVVLIHWGVGARWAEPLRHEPALAERFSWSPTTGPASEPAAGSRATSASPTMPNTAGC